MATAVSGRRTVHPPAKMDCTPDRALLPFGLSSMQVEILYVADDGRDEWIK
jgi:hypothetical protein